MREKREEILKTLRLGICSSLHVHQLALICSVELLQLFNRLLLDLIGSCIYLGESTSLLAFLGSSSVAGIAPVADQTERAIRDVASRKRISERLS